MSEKSEICRVSKKNDGGVVVAWLDRETDDVGFAVINLHCTFTRIGPHRFVLVKGPFGRPGYTFALIVNQSADKITVAYPKDEEFLAMVDDGQLVGEIQRPQTKGERWPLISSNAQELVAAIKARGLSTCFDFDKKREFRRMIVTKD